MYSNLPKELRSEITRAILTTTIHSFGMYSQVGQDGHSDIYKKHKDESPNINLNLATVGATLMAIMHIPKMVDGSLKRIGQPKTPQAAEFYKVIDEIDKTLRSVVDLYQGMIEETGSVSQADVIEAVMMANAELQRSEHQQKVTAYRQAVDMQKLLNDAIQKVRDFESTTVDEAAKREAGEALENMEDIVKHVGLLTQGEFAKAVDPNEPHWTDRLFARTLEESKRLAEEEEDEEEQKIAQIAVKVITLYRDAELQPAGADTGESAPPVLGC